MEPMFHELKFFLPRVGGVRRLFWTPSAAAAAFLTNENRSFFDAKEKRDFYNMHSSRALKDLLSKKSKFRKRQAVEVMTSSKMICFFGQKCLSFLFK